MILLLSLFCLLSFGHSQEESTLQLAQLLYRHGDRTPTHLYPTDPNKEFWKPLGMGELTKIGMQQHFALGQYLRERYSGFLNSSYTPEEIYIRSTDVDRALMSAECNLAGMFPPSGGQVWNPNLDWQPIPIHTIPKPTDYLLEMGSDCPLYDQLVEEALNSTEAKELLDKYKDLFEFLSKNSGKNISTFDDTSELYGCLQIEKLYNLTIPQWVDQVWDRMTEVRLINWAYKFPDFETRKLRGGPLVGEMVSNMNKKISGDKLLVHVYSAHDSTIAAFLSTLSIWDQLPPPYASTVIVELHNIDDQFVVQISYRNTTQSDPTILTLPECTAWCPLETFKQLTASLIPTDIEKECQLSSKLTNSI